MSRDGGPVDMERQRLEDPADALRQRRDDPARAERQCERQPDSHSAVRGSGLSRRRLLRLLAATPLAGLAWSPADLAAAHLRARAARQAAGGARLEPQFFTAAEYRTVRILADMIIPADGRSGSASDAGVPDFMDFMMLDRPPMQAWMRGGLAWLDVEALGRFEHRFADCSDDERRRILDDIAWPARARPEMSQGAAFFSRFRDLTASGFWTSEMGVEDLQYMGNRVTHWSGCPAEVLERLGLE